MCRLVCSYLAFSHVVVFREYRYIYGNALFSRSMFHVIFYFSHFHCLLDPLSEREKKKIRDEEKSRILQHLSVSIPVNQQTGEKEREKEKKARDADRLSVA